MVLLYHINIDDKVYLLMLVTIGINRKVSCYAWFSVDNKTVFYFKIVFPVGYQY